MSYPISGMVKQKEYRSPDYPSDSPLVVSLSYKTHVTYYLDRTLNKSYYQNKKYQDQSINLPINYPNPQVYSLGKHWAFLG